jgi:hypothetical protein
VTDFLSNLIGRSFADAPIIRPRVPSLFEPTAAEFFDEPELSASMAGSESSPAEKAATAKASGKGSASRVHEQRSTTDTPDHHTVPPLVLREREKLIVPFTSPVSEKDHLHNAKHVSETFSETRGLQSSRQKRSSPVEQRSSGSAQIIRVTIGRVDVRAISPPAAAPKQTKPASPKLSLEDYLRKRERGSR